MAKFAYKMQNILDIKFKMEDQAKTAFATAMAALNLEEERMQNLKDRKQQYEDEGRALRSDAMDILKLKENTAAIENLKQQIEEQALRVRQAQTVVEKAREKLKDAMVERKIQEKLKENAFEEFKKELNAAESKEVDELVSYRHGRK
ncbi:MAG: flagellar export protein FliJ [Lachnospiraceae bacterium]|nr:flagellar export protein FliJ [Candidatus Colinaster equi]